MHLLRTAGPGGSEKVRGGEEPPLPSPSKKFWNKFLTNAQSRFATVVLDRCPGTSFPRMPRDANGVLVSL